MMKTTTLILLLALCAGCFAEFPIGAYTYMKSYSDEQLYPLLAEAGYDFFVGETELGSDDQAQTLLERSGKYGLKLLLIDRQELYDYSCSNHLLLDVKNGPGSGDGWYILGQETGRAIGDQWVCETNKDQAGYAINGIQYRKNGQPLDHTFFVSDKDMLYIRVRMSWSAGAGKIPPGSNIVSATLYGFADGDRTKPVKLDLLGPILTENSFSEEPRDYIFTCTISKIPASCRRKSDYFWMLYGPDFRLRWNGLGTLRIDEIEIYDTSYKHLSDGEETANILTRMAQIAENPNLMGIMVKDEPCTPQFDGIRLFKEIVARNADWKIPIMTANWMRQYDQSGGSYIPWDDFLQTTRLDYIGPDIYPVSASIQWNSDPQYRTWHIQTKLDEMTDLYRMHKKSALRHDAKFIAVVQTTGYWYGNDTTDGRWKGSILPPSEMIKCLRYLPLCYGADGIIDWKLRSGRRANSTTEWKYFYQQSPIDMDGNTTPQYDAIMESNERIHAYGSILQGLQWIGAHHDPKEIAGMTPVLRKVEVKSADSSAYTGNVEVGLFQDESLYFMIVNRRTNFLKPQYGNRDGVVENVGANGKDVAEAFAIAQDQTLTLHFNDDYGFRWYLEEMISGEKNRLTVNHSATITIPAGEGRLYKLMAESDPSGIIQDHR